MKDRDGEVASFSIRGVALTAGNITAEVAKVAAIKAAVEGVSLLVVSNESLLAIDTGYSPTLPTDPYAERGIKFLVRGVDGFGNPQRFHISGAAKALAGLMIGESMDLASTEGAALVAALEDYWVSNASSPVTVQEIVYVD
jgi:hypothetical protein